MAMKVGKFDGAGAVRHRFSARRGQSSAHLCPPSAQSLAKSRATEASFTHASHGPPFSAHTLQPAEQCACLGTCQAGRHNWLRSYTLLRELVRDCGGTLVEDRLDGGYAAHACATFVGTTNIRYRLRWDIKEGFGMLQVAAPDGTWEDVIGARKKQTGSYTNFRAFIEAAERLAGRRLG